MRKFRSLFRICHSELPMTKHHGLLSSVLAAALLPAVGGCPAPKSRVRLDPIPMRDAVRIINNNQSLIHGTLRASGTADGYFTTPDGHRRSFHLDATLFFLAPSYFRFDLKKFGDRQVLFGCNDERHWYYSKKDDVYLCGGGAGDDLPTDMPVRPDQIVEALGLSRISDGAIAAGLLQRVEEDNQQLLFVIYDDQGRPVLEKEYWLDRYAPRLVRRIVFRDSDGVVEMQSDLDEYRRLMPGGPWLPHVIRTRWSKSKARIDFRAGRWTAADQVEADSIQFATPPQCHAQ